MLQYADKVCPHGTPWREDSQCVGAGGVIEVQLKLKVLNHAIIVIELFARFGMAEGDSEPSIENCYDYILYAASC